MDYQTQEALNRKADTWKVEELQRTVDNFRRENSNLTDSLSRLQNNNQILHEALRQTLQTLVSNEMLIETNELHSILNQL